MTSAHRKQRAAATQRIVAAHLAAHLAASDWPYATDTGSGRLPPRAGRRRKPA